MDEMQEHQRLVLSRDSILAPIRKAMNSYLVMPDINRHLFDLVLCTVAARWFPPGIGSVFVNLIGPGSSGKTFTLETLFQPKYKFAPGAKSGVADESDDRHGFISWILQVTASSFASCFGIDEGKNFSLLQHTHLHTIIFPEFSTVANADDSPHVAAILRGLYDGNVYTKQSGLGGNAQQTEINILAATTPVAQDKWEANNSGLGGRFLALRLRDELGANYEREAALKRSIHNIGAPTAAFKQRIYDDYIGHGQFFSWRDVFSSCTRMADIAFNDVDRVTQGTTILSALMNPPVGGKHHQNSASVEGPFRAFKTLYTLLNARRILDARMVLDRSDADFGLRLAWDSIPVTTARIISRMRELPQGCAIGDVGRRREVSTDISRNITHLEKLGLIDYVKASNPDRWILTPWIRDRLDFAWPLNSRLWHECSCPSLVHSFDSLGA